MKKHRPFYRKKRFYLLVGIVGFFMFVYSFLRIRLNDTAFTTILSKTNYPVNIEYYDTLDHTIRYVEIGNDNLPLVVLIHGAPSSSASWESVLVDTAILKKAKFIAVDRPGYGYSDFGKTEKSIATQADVFRPILEKYRSKHDKILVLGSSYGGPVAAKMAMDYPELMDGIFLMSASVEPTAEKIYPITYPTSHWSLRWMVPSVFRVANAEKLSHEDALIEILNDWDNITVPATIFHGMSDDLIYYSNAEFAFNKMQNAPIVDFISVTDGEHGMLWSKTILFKREMMKAINRMNNYN